MTKRKQWDPRFRVYAHAHGKTPHAMMRHDVKENNGAQAFPFANWLMQQWAEFAKSYGIASECATDYPKEFDKWLKQRHA